MSNELFKRILTSLLLIPILVFSVLSDQYYFNIILVIVFFISIYEWFKINKNDFFYLIIGTVFILLAILSAYIIRGDSIDSKILFLWILSIAFFSDTGGYIFGKIIGGRKLTKISPNKTTSGMFGSFFFAVLPITIINFLDFDKLNFSTKTFVLSLIFSAVCQFGDITISYFKRKNNIKDTGTLLPGHGGILDRIDGLIFLLLFSFILKYLRII